MASLAIIPQRPCGGPGQSLTDARVSATTAIQNMRLHLDQPAGAGLSIACS